MQEKRSVRGGGRAAALLLTVLALCFAARPGLTADASAVSEATENSFPILIDGEEESLTSYLIDGSSYTRLRDIGERLGFDVTWDEESRSIHINTEKLHAGEDALIVLKIVCVSLAVLLCAVFLGIAIRRQRVSAALNRVIGLAGENGPEEEELDELREQARSAGGLTGEAIQALLRRGEAMSEGFRNQIDTANEEARRLAQNSMTEEICRSAIPQPLSDGPETSAFAIAGEMLTGAEPSCTFYDYFFLDKGQLCFAIGQVPGGSVGDALYMVVAQTTIRSRLRTGRSLTETMSDANAQLYDLGQRRSMRALVGILNVGDGRISYVNAGGSLPLILRSGERYEWYEGPVFAPLGMNEHVSYRQEELRLRQGDRLFLYTAGLAEAQNTEGSPFREKEFRIALNRSRGKTKTPEALLHFVRDEALVYCEHDDQLPGYSALVLEYRKSTRDLAFCELPALPGSAPAVMTFLKQACQDNGISAKASARLMVMADELFALCRRRCKEESSVRVECAVAPDGQIVNVRMTAPLGGSNPLEEVQRESDQTVSDFIRKNAEYVRFKAGGERDTVTIVYPLDGRTESDSPSGPVRQPDAAAADKPVREEVTAGKNQSGTASLTVALKGRLDTNSAPELQKELSASIDGLEELVLDLKDLEYVSSAGLRVFLYAQQVMSKRGKMTIRNANEDVMEIFGITGFEDILNIEN